MSCRSRVQPPVPPEPLTNSVDWVILYVVPPTVWVYSCGVDSRASSALAGSLRSCSWDWAASTEAWLCARSSCETFSVSLKPVRTATTISPASSALITTSISVSPRCDPGLGSLCLNVSIITSTWV